jgi:large subunit ribosomal protein L24
LKVRVGDTVKVLSGKDRSKTGKVVSILRGSGKVVVEKVNMVKKHKKRKQNEKDPGGIIEVEAPLQSAKLQIICSSCSKPTRVSYKVSENKKVRICQKCKAVLD